MNMTFLIMVGGRSGVGKTSLINTLLRCYPEIYERPISYTSRNYRSGENQNEYVFSSAEMMNEMRDKKLFLNFDLAYGNYYAMTKASVDDIRAKGKNAIKEIHPSNMLKIRDEYEKVISVLVMPIGDQETTADMTRRAEDDEYYNKIDANQFDIVFANDKSVSMEENAYYLNLKICTKIKYLGKYPPRAAIDSENASGYTLIADEFTEAKRITTHNFHDLSQSFFQGFIDEFVDEGSRVLEIGPGQGWLRSSCRWKECRYDALDLTEAMAKYVTAEDMIISSISNCPISTDKYDIVVSSLGDPYFYPDALCEICRILKPGGRFAFSIPARQWADNLRSDKTSKTTFISENGNKAETYSFVYNEQDLIELLPDCGFEVVEMKGITGGCLADKKSPISPAIIDAAQAGRMSIDEMEIVTVCVTKKRG